MSSEYQFLHALPSEAQNLRTLQVRSFRELGRGFYAEPVIESFLRAPGTMDDAVLAEGHYFAVRDRQGQLVGSGGWSQLQPGYAKGGASVPAASDRATVRSVFVDPDFARRGIGSALMRHIEADCVRACVTLLTLTATLSGVALYKAMKYAAVQPRLITLSDGTPFEAIDMEKDLRLRQAA